MLSLLAVLCQVYLVNQLLFVGTLRYQIIKIIEYII